MGRRGRWSSEEGRAWGQGVHSPGPSLSGHLDRQPLSRYLILHTLPSAGCRDGRERGCPVLPVLSLYPPDTRVVSPFVNKLSSHHHSLVWHLFLVETLTDTLALFAFPSCPRSQFPTIKRLSRWPVQLDFLSWYLVLPIRHLHLDNQGTHNTHAHHRTSTFIPKPNSLFFSLLLPTHS